MDDVIEVVRKGCEQELTEHLNSIDTTGSIKFTYEEESYNSLPFLEILMIRKEDGTVKLLVYQKKMHTDQYLNFASHHPLHQKLGVIKTLLDRCNNIVSEPEDREKEVEHITKALEICGYPSWTIKNVKEQQSQKEKTKEKKETNTKKSKGMDTLPYVKGMDTLPYVKGMDTLPYVKGMDTLPYVKGMDTLPYVKGMDTLPYVKGMDTLPYVKGMDTLPYVKGVTEPVQRIIKHQEIATSVRPHENTRRILVHPKDKVEDSKKTDCVYQVPCKSCNHIHWSPVRAVTTYIGPL